MSAIEAEKVTLKTPSAGSEATVEDIKADTAVFIQEDLYVTTVDDEKLKVPRLNWKKELILINLIQGVLKDMGPTLQNPNGDMVTLLSKVLEVAPEKATKFVSTVMGLPDEWVEEKLDISEVVAVILPLLRNRLDLILQKLTPYLQEVGAKVAGK